jgi:hypothetical protein
MKLIKNRQHYILLIAICLTLIGLIALFLGKQYENSVQGTHEKGMFNLFEYISKFCLIIGSFSFMGFVVARYFFKNQGN